MVINLLRFYLTLNLLLFDTSVGCTYLLPPFGFDLRMSILGLSHFDPRLSMGIQILALENTAPMGWCIDSIVPWRVITAQQGWSPTCIGGAPH